MIMAWFMLDRDTAEHTGAGDTYAMQDDARGADVTANPPSAITETAAHLKGRLDDLKIGLALGGGAARGWAHIGVLHALDDLGVKPDVIAGTSIGAVVGGCHLAGKLDGLEKFARGLSRRRVFGLLDLNFSGSSLIGGNKLIRLLEAQLKDTTIESLPKQFVAITAEMGTGHEIWLSRGRLVPALCASYALPGIFKPVNINDRWLLDGALVNPIPVSVCRAFGARLVIAVNLSSDVFGHGAIVPDMLAGLEKDAEIETGTEKRRPRRAERMLLKQLAGRGTDAPGIPAVMADAFNIVQDRIARSRLAGDPPDVTVSPRVGKIGLFEFHRAAEAIEAGYTAVTKAVEALTDSVARLR